MTLPSTRPPTVCVPRHQRSEAKRYGCRTRLCVELLEDRRLLAAGLEQPLAALSYTHTEVVAAVKSSQPLETLANALHTAPAQALTGSINLAESKVMPSVGDDTLVEVALADGADPMRVVTGLEELSIITWASPNYVYDAAKLGDPRELTPNDPSYGTQYHHTLMKNNQAWDLTMGRSNVIIAATDDGVDIAHVDLYDNIWINQGEIPAAYRSKLTDVDADGLITMRDLNNAINKGPFKSNDVNGNGRIDGLDLIAGANGAGTAGWSDGINNDANGYIDDIIGWDFSSNDLNPGGGSHGTHVAGIAAAHTNNAVGVAGTAGNTTFMPIRFYGSGSWTSTVIYNSYAYAANNGAKIVTTSYNVDGFVGDTTFTAALNYMYGKGVLHFNSAGNNSQNNPARAEYDQTLYVVATNSQDKKASYSNYGYLTDVSAPGDNIYSTYPTSSYEYMSGTSMASPNAAAVAALIWSLHPTWTRDQVAAQLLGTADNINGQNPSYQDLLGSGRVNSYRALTETLKPPKFDDVIGLPNEGGTHNGRLTSFEVEVGSVFSASSMMNPANWQLRWAGFDGVLNNGDDWLVPLNLNTAYMVGTNRFKFTVSGRTPPGLYQFKAISGGLVDPFNKALDGNGDGVAGDPFVRNFYIGVGAMPGGGGRSSAITAFVEKHVQPALFDAIEPGPRDRVAVLPSLATDSAMEKAPQLTTATRTLSRATPAASVELLGLEVDNSGGF